MIIYLQLGCQKKVFYLISKKTISAVIIQMRPSIVEYCYYWCLWNFLFFKKILLILLKEIMNHHEIIFFQLCNVLCQISAF